MLIREAISWGILELENFTLKQLESRILLAHALNTTQELLLVRGNEKLSSKEKTTFHNYVKRRKSLEPIAYILKKKEFYSRDFLVNKNVLIPRPETEIIIDRILLEYKKKFTNGKVRILDLGTGSGVLAVTLAKMIPKATIIATDMFYKALKVAEKNAEFHGVIKQIQFIKSNWYSNIPCTKFNFIISNPPYISMKGIDSVGLETLLYEPNHALFVKAKDEIINYKKVISGTTAFLDNQNKIFLEIAFNQLQPVKSFLKEYQYTEFVVSKDLAGHERVVEFSVLPNTKKKRPK